jgi:hypothetical protein
MKEKIKFPADVEEVVKSATFINMGKLFHKWKLDMNKNYVSYPVPR